MILSDRDLLENLKRGVFSVNPISEKDIQPASIDLHVGEELKNIDGELIHKLTDSPYIIKPHEFLLASTYESVRIGDLVVGQVDGKSTIGRLGLQIHCTAGWIDSGFYGNITLEIINVSNKPFTLHYYDSICQLIIMTLSRRCARPYGTQGLGSKYQGSQGTVSAERSEYYE